MRYHLLWPVVEVAEVAVDNFRLGDQTTTHQALPAPHKVHMDKAKAVATVPEVAAEVVAKTVVLVG
jgi:hypothetical protein